MVIIKEELEEHIDDIVETISDMIYGGFLIIMFFVVSYTIVTSMLFGGAENINEDKFVDIENTIGIQGVVEEQTRPEEIGPFVENITEHCEGKEDDYLVDFCKFDAVSSYAKDNITYTNKTKDIPSPMRIVNRGYGRCVGKAVLFSSMVRYLGYETQYVTQENHLCVLVEGSRGNNTINVQKRFWNCLSGEIKGIY